MPINTRNFIIEPPPVTESAGLVRLGQSLDRNREWQYRHQKDLEAEQYRKANLIQELTDLSKHQTGSDVANAVGNKLMSDIYQKYTSNADKMSPLELQANIQKDMSGIITGMDTMKNELANADKTMMAIKTAYPGLDTASLYNDVRQDIVHRRMNDDTSGFRNEMQVPQSGIDLSNPETLSRYVTGDKNLRTYFTNPKGLDKQDIFTGNRNNYTKFHADIPVYKKIGYNPEDVKEGFLTKGSPSLKFKSSVLPSDALPSSKNAPFEMIDKDVFDTLGGQEKLELIAATRRQVPGYDDLNPTSKEYAQRHVYLKTAKALDQLDFHPTDIHTPSASLLRFEAGGSGGANNKPIELQDIHKEVMDAAGASPDGKVALPKLTPEAQGTILDIANKLSGRGGDLKMNQDQVYVQKEGDDLNIVNAKNGKVITKFPYKSANLPANTGIKAKQEVLKRSHEQPEATKSTYKIKGKTYSEKELFDMGYTLDDIKSYKQ